MNVTKAYFELLRSALSGTAISRDVLDFIKPEVLPKLFNLSKMHDTAHLIARALNISNVLVKGSEAEKRFLQELNLAIYRVEQIDYEISAVSEVLEQTQTNFIMLKGANIRQFYPESWMRTSCDIDLLVRDKDIDKVIKTLTEKLEYTVKDRDPHEVTLNSKSGVCLELHFELLESRLPKAMKILKNVWDYTEIKEGKQFELKLTDEMFYFYHITHMAKHFVVGGCGVRPFMDIWVIKRFSNIDIEKASKLLEKADLLTFSQKAEELAEVWFSNVEKTPLMEQLETFVLKGGAYGSYENGVAVRQVRHGGKFRYFLSRIFVSFEVLKGQYPVLKKHPYLMPIFQVVRWFRMIFGGRMKRTVNELKASGKLTKEQVNQTAELLEQIGL